MTNFDWPSNVLNHCIPHQLKSKALLVSDGWKRSQGFLFHLKMQSHWDAMHLPLACEWFQVRGLPGIGRWVRSANPSRAPKSLFGFHSEKSISEVKRKFGLFLANPLSESKIEGPRMSPASLL